ncbi:MAG: ArnT family glycosyltransferase [Caldilineaceae bacterium]
MSNRAAAAVGILALALNALILAPVPWQLRALSAFLLAVPVTGFLLCAALRLDRQVRRAEYLLLAMGAGYAVTVLFALMLTYLPGGLGQWPTVIAFDALAGVLFIIAFLRRNQSIAASDVAALGRAYEHHGSHNVWLWLAIASLVLVASFLRVPGISYSEFQDDEVSVITHAAEAIQGREDGLFVHDKGPAEILVTAAVYTMADRMNEASARLPFAIANVTALLALFWLGWRFFGPVAGWVAAMVLAVDGYFIGFSRIVQYQSLVFLMVVLVAGIIYLYVEQPRRSPVLLYLAALFFATGVLAHFEAALVAIPVIYLAAESMQRRDATLRSARNFVLPVLLAFALLLLFYLPFSQHPRFARTFAEITGNRIGTGFPYNNLADFFTRTIIYSSTYYFAFLVAALTAATIAVYRKTLPIRLFWAASAVLVAVLAGFFIRPELLRLSGTDYAWLFFAVAVLPAILGRKVSVPERAVWLWFSFAFILALFITQKPRTHVYDFFIPMSLLIGNVSGLAWQTLDRRLGRRPAATIGVSLATVLTLVFANYGYWMFVHNQVEVLRTWEENRPRLYWTPMKSARQNAIFGFPFKNGWKVVGALYADGTLDAPFARNGKRGVSNWYTRFSAECPRDAQYYVFTPWNEPTNKGLTAPPQRPSEDDGYSLIHVVTVNGESRLEIYERDADETISPQVHDIADYESFFDAELSGPLFEAPGVAGWTEIEHPLDFRFGSDIWLEGYTLQNKQPRPGERVDVTLYWQTTATPGQSYKVFTQIIDPDTYHKAGQRDGVPVCDRLPTDRWLPGDTIVDRYSIVIARDAPAGDYALLIGMYDDNGDRLDIYSNEGDPVGDALGIDTITVTGS